MSLVCEHTLQESLTHMRFIVCIFNRAGGKLQYSQQSVRSSEYNVDVMTMYSIKAFMVIIVCAINSKAVIVAYYEAITYSLC